MYQAIKYLISHLVKNYTSDMFVELSKHWSTTHLICPVCSDALLYSTHLRCLVSLSVQALHSCDALFYTHAMPNSTHLRCPVLHTWDSLFLDQSKHYTLEMPCVSTTHLRRPVSLSVQALHTWDAKCKHYTPEMPFSLSVQALHTWDALCKHYTPDMPCVSTTHLRCPV